MGECGDRGFVNSSGDELSQLSKKLFFSFRFVGDGNLEIWIWGVSVVTPESE